MASVNKVILLGTLGRDEFPQQKEGTATPSFSVRSDAILKSVSLLISFLSHL